MIWEGSEVAGFAGKKATDGTVYVVMYFNPPGNNETMSFYENVNRVTGAGDAECGHGAFVFNIFHSVNVFFMNLTYLVTAQQEQ